MNTTNDLTASTIKRYDQKLKKYEQPTSQHLTRSDNAQHSKGKNNFASLRTFIIVAFLAGLAYIYFISHAEGQVVSEGEIEDREMAGNRKAEEREDSEI